MASQTTPQQRGPQSPPEDEQQGQAGPLSAAAAEAAGPAAASIWANRDFLKLWGGQSLSLLGSQVTVYAIPLVAVVLLNATPGEMGLLGALARLPFVLFLFAGVWADRTRRRPTMIVSEFGSALLIGAIPVAYLAHMLTLSWLYVIAPLVGILGVFFEVANQAFLPSLVGKEHIAEGNAKMQISQSVAQVGGPGIAAALIAVVSAASLIFIDAASCLVSAIASMLIRKPEPKPGGDVRNPHLFAAMGSGITWVWKQRLVRPMMFATGVYMLFATGIQVLYVLYTKRTLGLSPAWIGVTMSCAGIGALIGSTLSLKVLRKIGPGPAAAVAITAGNVALLLIPLATGPMPVKTAMLAVAQAVSGLCAPIAMVGMGSLRMHLTPNDMQGRVVATFHGLSLGLAPLGAVAAGFLGNAIGLRQTMFVLAIAVLIPPIVVWLSPLPATRTFPEAPDQGD